MDRKWTPKENEQFLSCWEKLVKCEITRAHFLSLFPHREWEYLRKHAEAYVGCAMPEGMMTMTAAAKKAGYSRTALVRMLAKHEKKIMQRSGRRLDTKNPHTLVWWADVMAAITAESEYMSANKAAMELSMCRADLIRILRELNIIETETQQRKSIMIHVSVVEELRKRREEKHPSIPRARRRNPTLRKSQAYGTSHTESP